MADYMIEAAFGAYEGRVIAALDEVGRGCLSGPVMAACCVLPPSLVGHPDLAGIDDSKRLSARRREILAAAIERLLPFGIGQASVTEIDARNILQATFLAMRRALGDLAVRLGSAPAAVLVDGNQDPALGLPTELVVDGDARSLSIAAASIIAKVRRDALMRDLAGRFPGYGWEKNAGYGTRAHLEGLARIGITPHHRRSFAPVAKLLPDAH